MTSQQANTQQAGTRQERPGRLARLRARYPWLDHLARAGTRYTEHHGNHYAAAITYFSVLSMVPLLMVAFAAAGFVLVVRPDLLEDLQQVITGAAPGPGLRSTLRSAVQQAIEQRASVGTIGLVVALYSGLGWMNNLREALTAQWAQTPEKESFLRSKLSDLLRLIGLGLALLLSLALTAVGGGLTEVIASALGLAEAAWFAPVLVAVTVLLSLLANWVVFLWTLTRLPRKRVAMRSAVRGALVAAIGFEVLKQVGTVYLKSVSNSPSGAAFGSLIGLLVFIYLASRFLLFVTAWTATSRENRERDRRPPPGPALIRPQVVVHRPDGRIAAAALGVVGLLGFLGGRRHRRSAGDGPE